jgi:hypothetical protein
MKAPTFILPAGTQVRTHRRLDPLLDPALSHLVVRRPNAIGRIVGHTHGGDVYVVEHEDGVKPSYAYTEFELGHEEQAPSQVEEAEFPLFSIRNGGDAVPANPAADELLAAAKAGGQEVLFAALHPAPRDAWEVPPTQTEGDVFVQAAMDGLHAGVGAFFRSLREAAKKAKPLGTDTGAGCDGG